MNAAFGDDYGERTPIKRIMELEAAVEDRNLDIMVYQRTLTKLRMLSKMRTSAFQQKCLALVAKAEARMSDLEREKWESAEAQELYSRNATMTTTSVLVSTDILLTSPRKLFV